MRNMTVSLMGVAALSLSANAGTSVLDIRVSRNGVNWAQAVVPDFDGSTVFVGYFLSYVPGPGEATPNALASLTFQPVFTNVRASDSVGAFLNVGNNNTGGAIDPRASYGDNTGAYGRVKPFAATGPSTSQSYQIFSHMQGSGGAPAGNYYRIARDTITNWMGTGPTTGTAAVNNFNGAGGIPIVQKQNPTEGVDPARVAGTTDVLVMVLRLQLGALADGESWHILATAPLVGMSRNPTTGIREASWYANTTETVASIKGAVVVHDGEINFIPAPSALAIMGLGVLAACRRRRVTPPMNAG